MKITAADHWFSKCVRERAEWRCEKCGKQYPQDSQGLHCHHLITRGNWAVRFEPLNGVALGYECHIWAEGNPFAVTEWAETALGENLPILRRKSETLEIGKQARKCQKEIAAHYKKQNAAQLAARASGARGRLEFYSWL